MGREDKGWTASLMFQRPAFHITFAQHDAGATGQVRQQNL